MEQANVRRTIDVFVPARTAPEYSAGPGVLAGEAAKQPMERMCNESAVIVQ